MVDILWRPPTGAREELDEAKPLDRRTRSAPRDLGRGRAHLTRNSPVHPPVQMNNGCSGCPWRPCRARGARSDASGQIARRATPVVVEVPDGYDRPPCGPEGELPTKELLAVVEVDKGGLVVVVVGTVVVVVVAGGTVVVGGGTVVVVTCAV